MTDKYIVAYIFVFAITFVTTVILEKILIPPLTELAKQPIYEDGPRWHIAKKGTPTMGGLAFLISITLGLAVSSILLFTDSKKDASLSVLLTLLYATANSVIGIIDDITKLKRNKNAGLTPKQKLFFHLLIKFRIIIKTTNKMLCFSTGNFI